MSTNILRNLSWIVMAVILIVSICQAQSFYFGCDLSYVNQMEDCGAVFKEHGQPKDVYHIFADHGFNLVRVRLWVDPSWWQSTIKQPEGVKSYYSDFEDVKETIRRSKQAGMQVLLDFHYSDFWADPGRQLIPQRWLNVAEDIEALKDSLYNYTYSILTKLDTESLMPEFVQIGNETNSGIMSHTAKEGGFRRDSTISESWIRHAKLFNAAIKAIRDVGSDTSINPKICVHFANKLTGHQWNIQNIIDHGITDFDIYGMSYYYAWHGGSIGLLEKTIHDLKTKYPTYEVMVLETAYPWSTQNYDSLINIVIKPDSSYLPVCPQKQLEYMVDYTRAVMRAGGKGIVFWEPAWVSTPCRTPWGQGSSHDHLAFFDPVNINFMENGGGNWPDKRFYKNLSDHKVTFKVDMSGQDVTDGIFISINLANGKSQIILMADEGNNIYNYFTYLAEGSEGGYSFLNADQENKKEKLNRDCAEYMGIARQFRVSDRDTVFAFLWESCEPIKNSYKSE